MCARSRRSTVLSILILIALLFPSWSPALGVPLGEQTAVPLDSLARGAASDLSRHVSDAAAINAAATLDAARRLVEAQVAQSQPMPVAPGNPLPPGTVALAPAAPAQAAIAFLPLILRFSGLPDLALSPDVWMPATADWSAFEHSFLVVRYPPTWQYTPIASGETNTGFVASAGNQTVQVIEEFDAQIDPANVTPHLQIAQYREWGYQIDQATFNGDPAWDVTPVAPVDGLCREVFVAVPGAWVRFQLRAAGDDPLRCQNQETFNLVLSSLQIRGGEIDPQFGPDLFEPLIGIEWMSYCRQCAYNYGAIYWDEVCHDGHDYPGQDGGHYVAHVLSHSDDGCTGSFPIHWCAGQDHNNADVYNIKSQRYYVKTRPNVASTSCSNLKVGDIVYIGKGTCWGWGGVVVSMSGGNPYITTHDVDRWNRLYTYLSSNCGTPADYDCVHIDSTDDHYDPWLNSGLNLSPSTQQTGGNVTASFNVHNYGGQAVALQLRVTTNGYGDWATTSCTLPAYGNCGYNQTRSFASTFTQPNTCAQMYLGGTWQNIPATGGGVTCRTLNIVPPASVQLASPLVLTPNTINVGGSVRAQFTVQNFGGVPTTERFRARVTSGSVTFDETGDVTLNAGQQYAYDNTKVFSQPGIYEVIADHRVSGVWTPLIGDGSGFIRVMALPPPPEVQHKGNSPTCGYAGEPVNTATGDYYNEFTDMMEASPGLTLGVTRAYNSYDAPDIVGPFGYGTSWQYNTAVSWRADKTAVVSMPDGHLAYFVGEIDPADPDNLAGVYADQMEDYGTLVRNPDGTGVLTLPDQTAYHFGDSGLPTHITHPYPAEITLVYSGTQLVQLVHSAGLTYTITYSGTYISNITASSGQAVTYTYSLAGDLETATRPDGSTYTYAYDANHRLTHGYDTNGDLFVHNVHDAQGRVVQQYDQDGRLSEFSYGAQITDPRSYTDALSGTITHTYDANFHLVQEEDALGYITTYTRTARGDVIARQDRTGAIWRYAYDPQGNMISETNPLGATWTYTFDAHNNRTSQTDPLGRTSFYSYDDNDRLLTATNPLWYEHLYRYNVQGNLIWEQDENGAATWYGYNQFGWQTAITDALGNVTRMGYDDLGNQTVYTDANGNVAYSFYDDLNRLVQTIDPLGTVVTFTYDLMGGLQTESDGMGHLKHYTFDDYGRLAGEADFNGNPVFYGYDALGRLEVVTDALGYTTVYTYNVAGQLTARRDKDGAVTEYEYDPEGRLRFETDPLDRITEYRYDAAGQQTEVRRPCADCPNGVAISYTYYDAAGQAIREVDARGAETRYWYDDLSRLGIVTDTYGYTRTYSYDAAGRVIQEMDQVGAITRYEYDVIGQLITATNALGYQAVNHYDPVGRLTETINERSYPTFYFYDANDNLITTTDALSGTTVNTYDRAGRLWSTTDPLGRTTTYQYDPNGNQTEATDPRDHTSYTYYDALNRPFHTVDALGHDSWTGYDAAGRTISQTNALGFTAWSGYDLAGQQVWAQTALGYTTVYTYNVAGQLAARQDPDGGVWRFGYDANGNQVSQTNPLGDTWLTEYDMLGRTVRETDPLGAVTEQEYDPAGRLIATTDPRGAVSRTEYDLLGQVVRTYCPIGCTQEFGYDAAGNQVWSQDQRGYVTSYVYNALNLQLAQTDALTQTQYTLYDAAGQVTATVDYNGNPTYFGYDLSGNQVVVTDALGYATYTFYDTLGQVVSTTNPLGHTSYTFYDAVGQVLTETTPLGHDTVYTYDDDGRQTARRDAAGYTWTTEYDELGRAIRELDPLGRVYTTTYDLAGQAIARTDPLGRTTTFDYDPLGRLLVLTGPDGTTQRYTYDPVGNVLTEQDGNGHITRYEYDLNGRLIRKTDPLGRAWHYQYDPTGNQTGTATPSGHVILQEYDPLGRLTGKSHDGVPVLALAYDPNGNRTAMTDTLGVTTYQYNELNQLEESTDPAGRTVQHTYYADGQRHTLTYPDGSSTAHYVYDADGALHQVTAPDGGVTHYERDALGRATLVTQANGVTVETVYDEVGNILSITQRDAGGTVFAQHAYTVDRADRRTQIVELLPQGTVTTTYVYDGLDRLVDSVGSDGTSTHYTFDDAGNRLTMIGVRLRGGSLEAYQVDYTYNAANQLQQAVDSVTGATDYTYDADGSRTGEQSAVRRVAYAYDAEARLVEARVEEYVGGAWIYKDGVYEQYAYDGSGHRVQKDQLLAVDNSLFQRREYRYDHASEWDVLQTYDTGATPVERRFLYDGALHKLAYWDDSAVGYFQHEALESVLGTTDASGAPATAEFMRYGDYGQTQESTVALPTDDAFTGYELDSYTGLDYARNRYYDLTTGTFISLDPYPAEQGDLLDLHRYLYVQGNPLNMVDPLGLSIRSLLRKVVESASTVRKAVNKIVQSVVYRQTTTRSASRSALNSRALAYLSGVSQPLCGIRVSSIARPIPMLQLGYRLRAASQKKPAGVAITANQFSFSALWSSLCRIGMSRSELEANLLELKTISLKEENSVLERQKEVTNEYNYLEDKVLAELAVWESRAATTGNVLEYIVGAAAGGGPGAALVAAWNGLVEPVAEQAAYEYNPDIHLPTVSGALSGAAEEIYNLSHKEEYLRALDLWNELNSLEAKLQGIRKYNESVNNMLVQLHERGGGRIMTCSLSPKRLPNTSISAMWLSLGDKGKASVAAKLQVSTKVFGVLPLKWTVSFVHYRK